MKKFLILALASLSVSACATITRGTQEAVAFKSTPDGATATITTPIIAQSTSCVTPCSLTVNRKDEFIVKYVAEGYKPQELTVKTQLASGGAAGFAGNIIFGGAIGMGTDIATGATQEHVPNPVEVVLEPIKGNQKVSLNKSKPNSAKAQKPKEPAKSDKPNPDSTEENTVN